MQTPNLQEECNMRKKPKAIDFESETRDEIEAIKSKIGQEVPLSRRHTQGTRAVLLSISGETATIRFPNGATLSQVPIRDLSMTAATGGQNDSKKNSAMFRVHLGVPFDLIL